MKKYIHNILSEVKKGELIYWWILRALMIFALIDTLTGRRIIPLEGDYKGSNPPIQIVANLVGMFAYEIIQLFPKNSLLRKLSPRFQNITAFGFLMGSFFGAYLNCYYAIPMFDKILHATGTAEGVYMGYEITCALQLKHKSTCHPSIAALCGTGIGFILASGWELFEFTYDQFFGGDAQHWNLQNAIDSAGGDINGIFQMFPNPPEIFAQRFALMDTMADIVMNFVGGMIMFLILRFFPYRHRGENDINKKIAEMNK